MWRKSIVTYNFNKLANLAVLSMYVRVGQDSSGPCTATYKLYCALQS
jgi:hypothetical protein